jgi:hypothetical protein
MLLFAFEPAQIPFTVAIGLMLVLALVQALALGGLELPEVVDDGATALDWLNSGRVPLMVLLMLGLAAFGICGLLLQGLASAVRGAPLPLWLAIPGALLAAVPVTRGVGRIVGRIVPRTETTAIPREALVGLRAMVTTGTARPGLPARARVRDPLGGVHQVLVEPEADGEPLPEGGEVLLLRRIGEIFRAMPVAPHPFLTPDGDVAL